MIQITDQDGLMLTFGSTRCLISEVPVDKDAELPSPDTGPSDPVDPYLRPPPDDGQVPGYVDEREVGAIAAFIASLDRTIPYSLLAFHPAFQFFDLPGTPEDLALRCRKAALNAGLRNLHVGNIHLLI